jgi:hypothetical protein
MAIFLPILGQLRGRIGDNVFSHNKGGDYVRMGTKPTNPNTERQQTTRTFLATAASGWSAGLSQAQRDAWDTYAETHPIKNSLGQDVYITGLAWYVSCQTRCVDAFGAGVTDPPVDAAPGGLSTFSVDLSAATTLDCTFTPALGADEALQVWVSQPVTAGATPNFRQCVLAGYTGKQAGSPAAVTTPHSFQSGQRVVAYAAVFRDDGLISSYLQSVDDSDF